MTRAKEEDLEGQCHVKSIDKRVPKWTDSGWEAGLSHDSVFVNRVRGQHI